MKDTEVVRQKKTDHFNSLYILRLTKISLLIFLISFCFIGKQEATWPLVSWVLYSGYSDRFRTPKPSVSAIELRVYTESGEVHVVNPELILSLPYDSLSHNIVEQAFYNTDTQIRDASRKYLIKAVSKYINSSSEIKSIQAWQLSYKVKPLEVPPIQVQNPTDEVMIGSFSQEDLVTNK